MNAYLYLHGWCSSPDSNKARFMREKFQQRGLELYCPDLNQPDFYHLTLSRQLEQAGALISAQPEQDWTIIGSSLGGLTALWLAEQEPRVKRLVLLAPAVNFFANALRQMGEELYAQWQERGEYPFYHYQHQCEEILHFEFMRDLGRHTDVDLQRKVPTLLLHGRHDQVILAEHSRAFAATRPWIELREVDDDHSLAVSLETIWQAISRFIK